MDAPASDAPVPSAAVPTATPEPSEVGSGPGAAFVTEPIEVSRAIWAREKLERLVEDVEELVEDAEQAL